MRRIALVPICIVLLCCATPALAAEDPAWDLAASAFVGIAIPTSTDVKGQGVATTEVDLENTVSFGGKFTAWYTPLRPRLWVDFGVQLDVTQAFPDIEPQVFGVAGWAGVTGGQLTQPIRISTTLIAVDLLVRLPVGVEVDLPNGRFAPYIGAGGGVQMGRVKVANVSDNDTAPALHGLAGLSVALTRHLAVFAEWQYTRAKHEFDLGIPCDATIAAHHLLAGITYHF